MITKVEQHGHRRQWLVRFQNKTHIVGVTATAEGERINECRSLLRALSLQTGWPLRHLSLHDSSFPFASVRVKSRLCGGKGGFGTLLKGQSKQAGANLTTDFGACRDLQGRRLRHVNDELKLRQWREIQRRKAAGEDVDEAKEYLNTSSGLYNWHLMLPSWANLSNKAIHKLKRQTQRQFDLLASDKEKRERARKEKEEERNQAVQAYVQRTHKVTQELDLRDAIRQGLEAKNKRKREEEEAMEVTDDEANANQQSILTISGDFVVEESSGSWTVQSKSDFATLVLVLDGKPTAPLYYEVYLETGGLAQIGWADLSVFRPDTESGDGVGDDEASFAVDGSRKLKFHGGKEETYGVDWRAGDILGCLYSVLTGKIRYSLNGKDLDVAFTTAENRLLVPALSCNQNEILELRTSGNQMKYPPATPFVAIQELIETQDGAKEAGSSEHVMTGLEKSPRDDSELSPITRTKPQQPKKKGKPAPVEKPEALDLSTVQSEQELEKFGMDRLKSALMAVGAKCGGSLQERAARLFSLKGLERKDFPKKVRAKNFAV